MVIYEAVVWYKKSLQSTTGNKLLFLENHHGDVLIKVNFELFH